MRMTPEGGMIVAMDYAVQSKYYTRLQAMLGQMIFRRTMILNTPFIYYWEAISNVI